MLTTVAHLAQILDTEERTLRRAVEQGTVRCRRTSPRRIDVPDDEEHYLREHWPLLRRLRATLRTEPNVRLAAMFGSGARGELHPDSDIDLLVALRSDSWRDRQRLNTRLERALDRPIDLVVLAHVHKDAPSLLADALRDGRVLADREDLWRRLKRREPAVRRAAAVEDERDERDARDALVELIAS